MNKSRPLRRGAIAGILLLIVGIIYVIFSFMSFFIGVPMMISSIISLFFTAILTLFSFFFYESFVVLAKKNNAKLLKVVSMIWVVFSLFFGVLSIGMGIYQLATGAYANYPSAGFSPDFAGTTNANNALADIGLSTGVLAGLIVFVVLFLLFFITLIILGGVGMLKLGSKFPIAKTIGILDIVVGGLMVTILFAIIGFIVMLVSMVMKIVLLFNASKFYKE